MCVVRRRACNFLIARCRSLFDLLLFHLHQHFWLMLAPVFRNSGYHATLDTNDIFYEPWQITTLYLNFLINSTNFGRPTKVRQNFFLQAGNHASDALFLRSFLQSMHVCAKFLRSFYASFPFFLNMIGGRNVEFSILLLFLLGFLSVFPIGFNNVIKYLKNSSMF